MITTILMDLDDTIWDFHAAERGALTAALRGIGVEPDERMLERYSEINLAQWKRMERGEIVQEQVKVERYRIFFREFGIDATPEAVAKKYEANLALQHELIFGARELLGELAPKYRLYAASNGTYEVQRQRIADSGIGPYFKDFFISKKIGFHKPDARFFSYCFAHIPDFCREETVMVGDSLTSDIQGGKNAGLATVWFSRNQTAPPKDAAQPDFWIGELSELPGTLEKMG